MTADRDIAAAVDSILDDPVVVPVVFLSLAFDSGTLYLHTDLGDITTLGQTWTGVGDLGSISGIEESIKYTPFTVSMRLSGLDSDVLDEALGENYFEREATVYLGFRDVITGDLKAAPDEMSLSYIDIMQIVDDSGAIAIELSAESEISDWDEAPLEYYTDTQLQEDYPGDLLLQYLPQMKEAKIIWGRSTTIGGAPPPPGAQPRTEFPR